MPRRGTRGRRVSRPRRVYYANMGKYDDELASGYDTDDSPFESQQTLYDTRSNSNQPTVVPLTQGDSFPQLPDVVLQEQIRQTIEEYTHQVGGTASSANVGLDSEFGSFLAPTQDIASSASSNPTQAISLDEVFNLPTGQAQTIREKIAEDSVLEPFDFRTTGTATGTTKGKGRAGKGQAGKGQAGKGKGKGNQDWKKSPVQMDRREAIKNARPLIRNSVIPMLRYLVRVLGLGNTDIVTIIGKNKQPVLMTYSEVLYSKIGVISPEVALIAVAVKNKLESMEGSGNYPGLPSAAPGLPGPRPPPPSGGGGFGGRPVPIF